MPDDKVVLKIGDVDTVITLEEAPSDEDWLAVKERAFATIGKDAKKLPDSKWKHEILEARHSPIRRLRYSFRFENIPSWVSVHLVRHVHAQPYVQTQRNDRQSGFDRRKAPQDTPLKMIWDMNAEELMVIANKRLCGQASFETRMVVKAMCELAEKHTSELQGLLVPMCLYQNGCHEMRPCGFWTRRNL